MKNVKFKADITVENDDFGIEINNKKQILRKMA